MAPKSALFTAGNPLPSRIPIPSRGPYTTQQKIACAALAEEKAEKAVPLPPPERKDKTGKPKPRTLPPPGEAFVTHRVEKKRKAKGGKALTTQEKIRVAEQKGRTKGRVPVKKKDVGSRAGSGARRMAKSEGMYAVLKKHDPSMTQYGSASDSAKHDSVLMKATERAVWNRERFGVDKREGVFRIMDLPGSVRKKIWREAVVFSSHFVEPERKMGGQQPDLGMVSRSVREEVLPFYYLENTFAVDVSGQPQAVTGKKKTAKGAKAPLKGIEVLAKWAAAIEEAGHFGFVRMWAFRYEPEVTTGVPTDAADDGSFVLSIIFKLKEDLSWDAKVEVHRHALCMLPDRPEFEMCHLQTTPRWLNQVVIDVVDKAKGEAIKPAMIVEIARAVQARAEKLTAVRCGEVVGEVVRSIEEV